MHGENAGMSDQVVWASMVPGNDAVASLCAGAGWPGTGSGGGVQAGTSAEDGLGEEELDSAEEDLDEDELDDDEDDDEDDDDDDLDEFEDDELDDEDDDDEADEIDLTADRYSRIPGGEDQDG